MTTDKIAALIEVAKKYKERECFGDSLNGFSAYMCYGELIAELEAARAHLEQLKAGDGERKRLHDEIDNFAAGMSASAVCVWMNNNMEALKRALKGANNG